MCFHRRHRCYASESHWLPVLRFSKLAHDVSITLVGMVSNLEQVHIPVPIVIAWFLSVVFLASYMCRSLESISVSVWSLVSARVWWHWRVISGSRKLCSAMVVFDSSHLCSFAAQTTMKNTGLEKSSITSYFRQCFEDFGIREVNPSLWG